MKLNKKNIVVIRFMLFSLFFGAGNLIFPPFLGQNAGEHTFTAILIYLSIGPGLSIPRAASVPFEMTVSPYWELKCSQFPSCVDFTGFNCIQNCVYCYYLSFFSKIALKHRPHYFHI